MHPAAPAHILTKDQDGLVPFHLLGQAGVDCRLHRYPLTLTVRRSLLNRGGRGEQVAGGVLRPRLTTLLPGGLGGEPRLLAHRRLDVAELHVIDTVFVAQIASECGQRVAGHVLLKLLLTLVGLAVLEVVAGQTGNADMDQLGTAVVAGGGERVAQQRVERLRLPTVHSGQAQAGE